MTYYQPVQSRIWIGSLDEPSLGINAQYNPKEVSIEKQIPWSQHQKGNTDGLQWEFTGAQGRSTTIELLFDGVEEEKSVGQPINTLQTLAAVRDASSTDPEKRRPHHCVAVWGEASDGVFSDSQQPRFQCVIQQLTVKYTMFAPTGIPLRATVTVKLQEATRVSMAANSSDGSSTDDNDMNGTSGDDGTNDDDDDDDGDD